MMLRSLAVAALTLAGSGVVYAQSVYLYVAPGASVTTGRPRSIRDPILGRMRRRRSSPRRFLRPIPPRSCRKFTWRARPRMRRGMTSRWPPMARHPASSCSGASMSSNYNRSSSLGFAIDHKRVMELGRKVGRLRGREGKR
jgi:hypothetical protein